MLLANAAGQTWIGSATMIGNLGDLVEGGIISFIWLVLIALFVLGLWRIFDAANAAAPEHRTMEPGMIWLLLIPIFQAFWNFRALPEVSKSLAATMRDKGLKPDDCGQGVGVVWSLLIVVLYILHIFDWMISGALFFVGEWGVAEYVMFPLGLLMIVVALAVCVCIVMYIVKVQAAKSKILAAGNTPSAPSAPAAPSPPA